MFGYVYMTTNAVNGKRYIGQHMSDEFDKRYKGSGVVLLKAIKKYGWGNFNTEILQECDNLDELNEAEIFWIHKYNAHLSDEFYNIQDGGRNNRHSPETIDKMRQMNLGEKNPMYGKHLSNEQKKQISKRFKGKKLSEEHKRKISESSMGKPPTTLGRKHTEEELRKQSEKLKGRVVSEETKRKLSEAKKGCHPTRGSTGMHWYNNGVINKMDFECPEGFVKGRLMKEKSNNENK